MLSLFDKKYRENDGARYEKEVSKTVNLRAERREKIAEFISCKRHTTVDAIFYEFEGTDYEASIPTIRRDLEYLIIDKNYGIEMRCGIGILAEKDWYYSRPISSKDIAFLEGLKTNVPKDKLEQFNDLVKRINRIRENF